MSEEELNAKKRVMDEFAGVLAGVNGDVDKWVDEVAHLVPLKGTNIVVTGAAGSGKSLFAKKLAKKLEVPCFDLDEYIPAGDKSDYTRRFYAGIYKMYNQMNYKRGWVLEHVHACSSDIMSIFRPLHAILLTPGEKTISDVAKAREALGKVKYLARAMETLKSSAEEFNSLPSPAVTVRQNWTLKRNLFLED